MIETKNNILTVKIMKKNFVKNSLVLVTVAGLTACGTTVVFETNTQDENLMSLTRITDYEEPCITPTGGAKGKNLFFAVRQDKQYYNIYMKEDVMSASMVQKTSGKNFNSLPAYNASTDKIAFSCQTETSKTADIYTIQNKKGTSLSPITDTRDKYESHPTFSNDGTYLAWDELSYSYRKYIRVGTSGLTYNSSFIEITKNSSILLKNLKTNEVKHVANGNQPSISPNGKKIAYIRYSSDSRGCAIWVCNIDGSHNERVTEAKEGYYVSSPCWSPDNKRILFSLSKPDKRDFDLYVVGIDGNNLKQLTKNNSYDGTPWWTSDNYIYFSSDRGNHSGNYQIWRFKYNEK